MAGNVAELPYITSPDGLAKAVAGMWSNFDSSRNGWLEEKKELRDYIFATDTSTTSNSALPWKNSTTLPKLCQIRDNLHANYLSAAFPNDDWLKWEGHGEDDDTAIKRKAIQAYISNKARESDLRTVMSQLLLDYIDYGNCFTKVEYVHEEKETESGEIIPGYIGPRAYRISPLDIVFDPRASSFKQSPHIIRSIKSVGEIKKLQKNLPEDSEMYQAIEAAMNVRAHAAASDRGDFNKQDGMVADGFGTLYDYYTSNMVEMLTFEGTLHDPNTGDLLEDMEIVVIDRSAVVTKRKLPNWTTGGTVRHCGWRLRPDNLWAMGPLDNLVGMQYRIDHLENLKADVFDLIAHPPLKIKGIVEDFTWGPGEEIHVTDGDVEMMAPPTNALLADNQIAYLEQRMEEYSGAPREAMGIRTPGEKTAFEVQSLQNAAGRIFQEKITSFEINLLEDVMNDYLETAKRNMDAVDYARVMDDDLGVVVLTQISKEDITARGKLRPVGARHFAAQAQMVQNLNGMLNGAIGQAVMPHLSTLSLAAMVEELVNVEKYKLFSKNAQLFEQADRERTATALQEELAAEAGINNQGDVVQ